MPSGNHKNRIPQTALIEVLEATKEMLLNDGQKWISSSVEELDRSDMRLERPVANQLLHSRLIAHNELWLLHVKVVEEVTDTITAIERAADDVIEAQPRFSVVHDLSQWRRQFASRVP